MFATPTRDHVRLGAFGVLLCAVITLSILCLLHSRVADAAVSVQNVSLTGPSTLYSGLVGWWTFDGKDTSWTTGITKDKSGNGNNGSLISMSTTSSPVIGVVGQALNFNGNGSNQEINIPSFSQTLLPVTMTAWIKTSALVSCGGLVFTRNAAANGINAGGCSNTSDLGFTWNNLAWGWDSGLAIPLNKWVLVALVIQSNAATEYIINNGNISSATDTTDAPYSAATISGLSVGYDPAYTTRYFNGTIDDVRVYNRALSANEILQLYNTTGGGKKNLSLAGPGNLSTGLAAWYTFDGKDVKWAGATSTDVSGNGQDATILNMTNVGNAVQGKMGQAFSFKSSTQSHLQTPLTTAIGTGSYSYTVWFKTTTSQLAGIISRRASGGSPQFAISMSDSSISSPGNLISIIDNDGTTARSGVSGSAYNDGKWHFVALVRDSTTATTLGYIDGSLAITSNATSMPNLSGTDNIMIGAAGNGGTAAAFYFTGSIDDARIYTRALSASEVAALYRMSR